VLWDTGQTGAVLWRNLEQLRLDRRPLAAVALSHAHQDHTGGLASVLERYPRVSIYGHSALFTERFASRDGELRAIGLQGSEGLKQRHNFFLSAEPRQIINDVWTTGTITPRPYPQGSSPSHRTRFAGQILADSYADDMSLVLATPGGLVLVCGCCHAGLRNTLGVLRRRVKGPLRAILGGAHLTGVDAAEIEALIDALRQEGSPRLYLNHCTGEKALFRLQQAFGEGVQPFPAGAALTFNGGEG
jgi:7,8-dihydropterin-6-yl-methyl-4-(beta-D-ribofuranosyl)aminobenzene 5'-phosphate synthase